MRFMKSIAISPGLTVSLSPMLVPVTEPKIPQAKQNLSGAFKNTASPLMNPQPLIAVLGLPGKSPVSWDTLKKNENISHEKNI